MPGSQGREFCEPEAQKMLMLFSPLEMPWTPGHHGYVGVSHMLWAYDTFKTVSLISE